MSQFFLDKINDEENIIYQLFKSNTGKSSFVNSLANKYITTESKKLQTTKINLSNTIHIDDFRLISLILLEYLWSMIYCQSQ